MAFDPVKFMVWQWQPNPEGVIGLNSSNIGIYPSDTLVPTPAALTSAAHPYSPLGVDELRRRVGALYQVPEEEVMITAGTSLANVLALGSVAAAGSTVAVESPVYEPLVRSAAAMGLEVVSFDRPASDDFRPDLEGVRRCLEAGARAVVLTDLHNPSGAPLLEADYAAVRALCEAHGAHLMIDEVYRDFSHLDSPRSRRADGGPVVTTASLTKVYGLSYLRVGWLLAPAAVLRRAQEISSILMPEVPAPTQVMALAALEQRAQLVAWSRSLTDPAWGMIRRFTEVEPRLGGPVRGVGTIWFPLLPPGLGADTFCAHLMKVHKVRVVPGSMFGFDGGVRVGITGDPMLLRSGLAKMSRALDELGVPRDPGA